MSPPEIQTPSVAAEGVGAKQTTLASNISTKGRKAKRSPEVLEPLTSRANRSFCWVKKPGGPPSRIDEPLTPTKLKHHLNGGPAFGVCPIKPGENTTRLAVLDFDSHKGATPWDDMLGVANDVASTLSLFGIESTLFRSSGGQGIHLYALWDQPQDAYSVRETMRQALQACNLKSGTGGVSCGEVEIFPKQNAVPSDGFGSMFILPCSGKSEPIGAAQWLVSEPVPVVVPPPRPERTISNSADVADLDRLRSALDAIPNSNEEELSYEDWFKVLCGVHDATEGSDDGLQIAHAFSAKASKYDPDNLDDDIWPYIHSDRESRITANTIYAMARAHGWCDPSIAEDFEVLEAAVPSSRYGVVSAEEFIARPPMDWIIKGVLPRAEVALVFGAPGSGKTFIALDLAGAIARGTEWRGHRVKQGRVVYLAAEGEGGFRNRLKAYAMHHQLDMRNIPFGIIPAAPNFLQKSETVEVSNSLLAYGKVDVVIVDTLAQVTPGANENAAEDMGRVISHCKGIHKATGALVVLVHHSGKDASKGARGWSGIKGALDAEIEISRLPLGRLIHISKQKDGADGAVYGFELEQIPIELDEDGDAITSCIVRETVAPISGAGEVKRRLGPWEKLVVEVVNEMATAQTDGIEAEAVEREVARRGPLPKDGKRDTRKQRAHRAVAALCEGDEAIYFLEDGVLSVA